MIGDYMQANLLFKVRKTARYVRIYGLMRTLVKIKGQHHMKSTQEFDELRWVNPGCKCPNAPILHVAMSNCGNYDFSWQRLADKMFEFLTEIADMHGDKSLSPGHP